MKYKITVLPGDGVGPEVMKAALAVLNEIGRLFGVAFSLTTELIGGCCYEKHGVVLTSDTLEACR